MRKIVIRRPGGFKTLEIADAAAVRPGPGEVRVKARAAGINFADCMVRQGYYEAAKGCYPMTPGFEFSGAVAEVGSGVAGLRIGDRVLGVTRFGAYSESVTVPAWQLWPCPPGWDYSECAALPAAALTAHYGLFRAGRVEAGETVLVHSAAGGVGSALLQMARIGGAKAVAVVGSDAKVSLCRRLGAFKVIDRSSQDLWAEVDQASPDGFDAVFDANGVRTLRQGFKRLRSEGRLVVYGFAEIFPKGRRADPLSLLFNYLRVPRFSPLDLTFSNRAVIGFNLVNLFQRKELAGRAMGEILGWVRSGKFEKVPVTLYPLERVAEAHQALESGRTTGKLVLTL